MRVSIGPYPKGKSKAKRKISVRIDNYDIWNMDSTLGRIVLPMLKLIKKNKAGSPGCLFDYSHHEKLKWGSPAFKRAEKKSSDAGHKKWAEIVEKMIWSFDQMLRDEPDCPNITKDKPAYETYQARLQEGFDLFGKWYRALWT